jgi:4-hydroxy-tetrahydrodipicolinate reductase
VVRYAAQRPDLEFVGAVDIDEDLIGRDLGKVADVGKDIGVKITADANATLTETKPDLVFHTTSSSLMAVAPQLEECIKAGANIVSSCEEWSYPHKTAPEIAAQIGNLAEEHNVTVLATGVNPGFLMDTWPVFMTAVCQEVRTVKAVRVQNAAGRRGPFQKKIGAGCTLEEFDKLVESGTLKHVGLPESAAMIAAGLGWELDEITETIEPIIADSPVRTDHVSVEPGQASGVKQVAHGYRNGTALITLEFAASVDAPESYDAVYSTGKPDMEVVVKGGTHGDIATAAILVNAAPRVIDAPAGFLTMLDIPPVSALGIRS